MSGAFALEFASAHYAGTYMNLFVTRRNVLTARFGDERENPRAEQQLRELFPGRSPCHHEGPIGAGLSSWDAWECHVFR